MRAAPALLALAAAITGGCSSSSSSGSSTGSPPDLLVRPGCAAAVVHYGAIPHSSGQGLPTGLPWVASRSSRVVGVLFYYSSRPFRAARLGRAVISTRGRTDNGSTKVLWWLPGARPTQPATITGHRLDGSGSFVAPAGTALGTTTHPSIVTIPGPGCWRITLRSGAVSGDVTFQAVSLATA